MKPRSRPLMVHEALAGNATRARRHAGHPATLAAMVWWLVLMTVTYRQLASEKEIPTEEMQPA